MIPLLLALSMMFAPMGPPPTPPVLTPAGEAAITAWQARFEAVKARQDAGGPPASNAQAVTRMATLDREGEAATAMFTEVELSPQDLGGVRLIAGFTLRRLAHENVETLKTRLPADGWFRSSRDGAAATHDAWWIVWRSEDAAFTQTVLARMAPLARRAEVSGEDYARLFDRTAVEAGRPQRYGTSWVCRDGVRTLSPLEEAAKIDRRRLAIHWSESLAAGQARLKIGEAC